MTCLRYAIILCVLFSTSFAQSTHLTPEQSCVLESFFRVLLEESEVGYVLLGKKPVCIHGFFRKDPFSVNTTLHKQSVALREGARIWEQFAPANTDLSIHMSDAEDPSIPNIIHVVAIHRALLREVLTENISLFQYVLGPSFNPEDLLIALTSREETYHTLLKEDKVLIGEMLGFGIQNALYVSRIENIEEEIDKDIPPFLNTELVSRKYSQEYLPFTPGFGFKTIKDELESLQKKVTFPSEKLVQKSPEFIFGCLKNSEENNNLIVTLEKAQEEIQTYARSQEFTEKILHKFTGIEHKTPSKSCSFSFQLNGSILNKAVAKGIWESVQDGLVA